MKYSPLLMIHVTGALVGLVSGWVTLFFRKGSSPHGAVGNVFFVSILAMCLSAITIAVMKQQTGNILGGTLTFYLVGTAWLTVKRRQGQTGRLELAGMLLALVFGIGTVTLGWRVTHTAHAADGIPWAVYFIFGGVALLAAAGDGRMLIRGGVFGGPRIARHLWRMCTALLIVTLSGLAGTRTHIFPEFIRNAHLFGVPVLMLPLYALPLLMIYWLFWVRFAKQYRKKKTITARIKATPENSLA